MPATDVYRDEQITVAQQAIFQITDTLMLPVENGWISEAGNLRSEIRFVNRWKGVYLLECSRPLALSLTCMMLSLEPEEVSEEDMTDVVGELLNTIAGNLKCLLPGQTELSIPVTSFISAKTGCGCSPNEGCVEQSEILLDGELGMLRLSLIHCG